MTPLPARRRRRCRGRPPAIRGSPPRARRGSLRPRWRASRRARGLACHRRSRLGTGSGGCGPRRPRRSRRPAAGSSCRGRACTRARTRTIRHDDTDRRRLREVAEHVLDRTVERRLAVEARPELDVNSPRPVARVQQTARLFTNAYASVRFASDQATVCVRCQLSVDAPAALWKRRPVSAPRSQQWPRHGLSSELRSIRRRVRPRTPCPACPLRGRARAWPLPRSPASAGATGMEGADNPPPDGVGGGSPAAEPR
jgi:hypothetical protein